MNSIYVGKKTNNLINISAISNSSYCVLLVGQELECRNSDVWEMVYVDWGEAEICTDERRVILGQGETVFLKPGEFHTVRVCGTTVANIITISFVCLSKIMNFFKGKKLKVTAALRKNIFSIMEEYENMEEEKYIGGKQLIQTYLKQIIIFLIRGEHSADEEIVFFSKEDAEKKLVSKMHKLVEDNIYCQITTESICNRIEYSRTYLSRLFKEHMGCTILKYIQKRKIEEAKTLIRKGEDNFIQISEKLCFDNSHYFSQVFKRVSGMTPSEYKRINKSI